MTPRGFVTGARRPRRPSLMVSDVTNTVVPKSGGGRRNPKGGKGGTGGTSREVGFGGGAGGGANVRGGGRQARRRAQRVAPVCGGEVAACALGSAADRGRRRLRTRRTRIAADAAVAVVTTAVTSPG